jgi:hypothetical protein
VWGTCERDWPEGLSLLAEQVPEELMGDVLDIARGTSHRQEALTALAKWLPQSLMSQALDVAFWIGEELDRADTLAVLTEYLPEDLLGGVFENGRAMQNQAARARVLAATADRLPKVRIVELRDAAGTISDDGWRADVLVAAGRRAPADVRPSVLNEALLALRACDGVHESAYRALLEQLPEATRSSVASDALAAARCVKFDEFRMEALAVIADGLPEHARADVLADSIKSACAIEYEHTMAYLLANELAPRVAVLPDSDRIALWTGTLHTLAATTRSRLLLAVAALAPAMPASIASDQLIRTVSEVCQWWI